MPYIIRPRQLSRMTAGFFISLLLVLAAPALAHASCPASTASNTFASFGDNAGYALIQGGTFESGAPGWSLSRSEVISETTPMGGSHTLALRPRAQVLSPLFCASNQYPTFRFLLRQIKGEGKLRVGVRWSDASGSHAAPVAALEGSDAWAPSPVLELASNLPLATPQSSLSTVQLTFETRRGAEWAIDNVYVDPYSR
jgi:hypothetical protein